MEAELSRANTKAAADAEALARTKQHAADLSEDLEAANRELEVCASARHLSVLKGTPSLLAPSRAKFSFSIEETLTYVLLSQSCKITISD